MMKITIIRLLECQVEELLWFEGHQVDNKIVVHTATSRHSSSQIEVKYSIDSRMKFRRKERSTC